MEILKFNPIFKPTLWGSETWVVSAVAGSESVDLEAKIMLARDSAAGRFSLEAYYSKGLIIEPKRFNMPMADNKAGTNDEDF